MKITSSFGVFLLLLFSLHDLKSQSPAPQTANSEQEIQYPNFLDKSGINIVSATYGSGVRFSDVTGETVKLLNQQSKFYAQPEWLLVDPTPGWNKAFVVIFTFQNRRYIFSCGEAGKVSISILKRSAAEKDAAAD